MPYRGDFAGAQTRAVGHRQCRLVLQVRRGRDQACHLLTAEHHWQGARDVSRHGLEAIPLQRLLSSSWQFTDRTFGCGLDEPIDRIVSPVKLYQSGFNGCQDTEDAFVYWLARMQQMRLLPA